MAGIDHAMTPLGLSGHAMVARLELEIVLKMKQERGGHAFLGGSGMIDQLGLNRKPIARGKRTG
jgi:hypothetical protein